MNHTCPVCNGVTCASGNGVEFSRFTKFCRCGGIPELVRERDELKAEVKRLSELAATNVVATSKPSTSPVEYGDYGNEWNKRLEQ